MEVPPLGLEKELESLYLERGRLAQIIGDAQSLVKISETPAQDSQDHDEHGGSSSSSKPASWEDKAIPRLSAGAILMLQRTVTKLEAILAAKRAPVL